MTLNSSVLNVFKISDEIRSRLFNHKPFIFGEIRFFIKEFEETRNDSDFHQTIDCFKRLTDFNETKTDLVIDLCHQFDDKLSGCVSHVDSLMQDILGLEANQCLERHKELNIKRDERNDEMIALIEVSKQNINEIDTQFAEQENNLNLFYHNLETNLKIISNSQSN